MINNSNRLNIGFLTESTTGFGGFQDTLWKGMVESAKEFNTNLYIFAGGPVDYSPHFEYEKDMNFIYGLINKEHIDGLIVCCTIGNYIKSERFVEFVNGFNPIPIVSTIGPIKGLSDIHINNKEGMENAILHLINIHNFKRIAFIKGYEGNPDAEERFNVYKEVLGNNGIKYDPDLVYSGDFGEASGARAVNFFIKEKNKAFDAIVASNDAMAFGAINELQKLGKRVPLDIAVIGFDDTEEAEAFSPSLTTVKQPFDDMNKKALQKIYEIIGGKTKQESISVPAKLIIRQSCGCFPQIVLRTKLELEDKFIDNENISERQKVLIDDIEKEKIRLSMNISAEQCSNIINMFVDDVKNDKGSFLINLNEMLQDIINKGQDVLLWQDALSCLRKHIYSWWVDKKLIFKAENIINQSRVLIGEISKQALSGKKILIEKLSKELNDAGQHLITAFNFESIKEELKRQLPRFNFPSCYISVIDIDDSNKSKIFFGYNDKGYISEDDEYKKHSLPPKNLLPQNRRFTFAVQPLIFKDQKLGYAVLELGREEGIVYNALQAYISSALMGSELLYIREKTDLILKQRADNIQELVKPMLNSINKVTVEIKNKMEVINNLMVLTKENSVKLNSTNTSIGEMGKKIFKMLDLISIIDDISVKVDMLALNASIESVHAGQFGKGFSVIASEIRKLSNSIKGNTVEISNLLKDIRNNITNTSKAGNDSLETFKQLEKDVIDVATMLKQTMQAMDELSASNSKILSIMNK